MLILGNLFLSDDKTQAIVFLLIHSAKNTDYNFILAQLKSSVFFIYLSVDFLDFIVT